MTGSYKGCLWLVGLTGVKCPQEWKLETRTEPGTERKKQTELQGKEASTEAEMQPSIKTRAKTGNEDTFQGPYYMFGQFSGCL